MKDKIVRIRADEDEWYPVMVFSDCENGFGIEVTEQERLNLLEIQKIRDDAQYALDELYQSVLENRESRRKQNTSE